MANPSLPNVDDSLLLWVKIIGPGPVGLDPICGGAGLGVPTREPDSELWDGSDTSEALSRSSAERSVGGSIEAPGITEVQSRPHLRWSVYH